MLKRNDISSSKCPMTRKSFEHIPDQDINVKLIVGIFRAQLPARRAEDLLAQKGHEEL